MKDSAHKKLKKTKKVKHVNKFTKTKPHNLFLYFIPVLALFIFFALLSGLNILLKYKIANTQVYDYRSVKLSGYPILAKSIKPEITAESAIIFDDKSKAVLYEKKPSLRFSMASTTKLMTALVGLEYFKPDDIITVKSEQKEGAVVGFLLGEKLKFEDMLFALLLPSSNDAAYAIAENYPGGVDAFVSKMNEKARKFNLNYTHYADPSGLDDDGNYTNVNDLAKLSSLAIKNKTLAKIISTKKKIITTIDGKNVYTLINLNRLLGTDGIVGIKTGFTQGAGEVLITGKVFKGHLFIIIVMKSEDRFSDTEILSQFINNNVNFINPAAYL